MVNALNPRSAETSSFRIASDFTGLIPPWEPDSFRVADNSPRASYFASRNDVSGQRGHLSDYATYQDFKEPYLFLPSPSFEMGFLEKSLDIF